MFTTPIQAFVLGLASPLLGLKGQTTPFGRAPGFVSVQLVADKGLRDLLLQLTPSARDKLRTVLIRDDRDRDRPTSAALRRHDGDEWADIIDTLTMHPDTHRKVVRLLAEIDASS